MANNSLYEYSVNPEMKGIYKFLYVFFKVIFILNVFIGVISALFAFYFSNFGWIICLIVVISLIAIHFIQKTLFSAYDCAFVDGSIRLDRIFNNKRTKVLRFSCKDIIALGGVNGEVYSKYIKNKQVKKVNLILNGAYLKDYCIYVEVNNKRYLVMLKYDEMFLSNILRITGGKIIEKSYKEILVK